MAVCQLEKKYEWWMETNECQVHYLKDGAIFVCQITFKVNEKHVKLVSPRFLYNRFK